MPRVQFAPLTGSVVLEELVAVIGWDAMLAVSRAFGGQQLDIPLKCGADHKIVKALGGEIADQLCDSYGNTSLTIPIKFRREAEIRHLRATRPDLTINQIAEKTMTHRRGVTKILAAPPRAITVDQRNALALQPRQMVMFGNND